MEYHCPECKKAVNHDRIQFLPWLLWLLYIALAPRPFPPNALVIAGGVVLVSVCGLLYYFKRHP